jgi:hypothetical protein
VSKDYLWRPIIWESLGVPLTEPELQQLIAIEKRKEKKRLAKRADPARAHKRYLERVERQKEKRACSAEQSDKVNRELKDYSKRLLPHKGAGVRDMCNGNADHLGGQPTAAPDGCGLEHEAGRDNAVSAAARKAAAATVSVEGARALCVWSCECVSCPLQCSQHDLYAALPSGAGRKRHTGPLLNCRGPKRKRS